VWKDGQKPVGCSERRAHKDDHIDGITSSPEDYWSFQIGVKDDGANNKSTSSWSIVVKASVLAEMAESRDIQMNYHDAVNPNAPRIFRINYKKEITSGKGKSPAKWVITCPVKGLGLDDLKFTIVKATAYTWIKYKPYFSVALIITLIGFFVHYAKDDCEDPMTDCPTYSNYKLAYRMCCREQIWRWFTYSLMHASVAHIQGNVTLLIVLAIPLEMTSGTLRVMLIYLFGALAGSLGSSVFDPVSNVVGASGAVYTYLGAWVADMVENWDTKDSTWACCNPFCMDTFSVKSAGKWVQVVIVVIFTFFDLGNQVYSRYNSVSSVSFAGHFCGFAAGVTFGTFMLKNNAEKLYELYVRWAGISMFITGLIFAVIWNVYYNFDRYGACDIDEYAKCNLTHNYDI